MEWSKNWKSSKQPRKQRKYIKNAPLHIKRKSLTANLNKAIRKEFKKRSAVVRKGDEVAIKRGEFKGQLGEVLTTNLKNGTITVKAVVKKKVNGTEYNVPIRASKVQITKLNLEDPKRLAALNKNIKKKETKEAKSEPKKQEIKAVEKKTEEPKKETDDKKAKTGKTTKEKETKAAEKTAKKKAKSGEAKKG